MTIGTVTADSLGCTFEGDGNFPISTSVYILSAKINAAHYVEVQIDGYLSGRAEYLTKSNEERYFWAAIPNDGRSHQVRLVDTGVLGTPAATSNTLTLNGTCVGPLKAEVLETVQNPTTLETYVTVKVTHDGMTSGTFTSRVLVDGRPAGAEIALSNGDYEPRTVTLPADGRKHLVKVEMRNNGAWVSDPILWYVVQAASNGDPAPLPTSVEASQFFPGETVIIQAPDDFRLSTTVSDVAYVLYAPKDTTGLWRPVGSEGGIVRPDEDGFWSTTIETNPTDFPAGSEWTVFVGRIRRQRGAPYGYAYGFSMVAGPPPAPPALPPPLITGPLNHNQRASCWMEIHGTGLPGSHIKFEVTAVTEWGRASEVPQRTTVKRDGTWRTLVYSTQTAKPYPYKILRYRAKAVVNGQESAWSNPLDVTWHYPIR